MRHSELWSLGVAAAVSAALILSPVRADAFCGFYVSGATGELSNDATMTVMMRDGMRTILSMQNNYGGPPEDFALVIPVPVVLKEKDVKTLDEAIFDKVDAMAAPRLVEYWEQDPCLVERYNEYEDEDGPPDPSSADMPRGGAAGSVKIEAQFKVGEYEVVILSATESTALDKWLRGNKYNIPKGADAVMKPYVEGGQYFFVAKVDVKKVKFQNGRAKLSPLRFHYDTKTFNLPIRLGLLNASGPQDLIVHILARGQRYEVANYKNVTIPTNIDVKDDVRKQFGAFYAALFDKTLAKNKGAVVTEYAWDASTCDPCPGPNLSGADFLSLGADVLPGEPTGGFVLTRLHARYTKQEAKEDLIFKAAPPIVGGREHYIDKNELEQSSKSGSRNNFQGRYAIRHLWEGKIECESPVRGRWGGRLSDTLPPRAAAVRDTAFAPRGKLELSEIVRRHIPEVGVEATSTTAQLMSKKPGDPASKQPASKPPAPPVTSETPPAKAPEASGGCATVAHSGSSALLPLASLGLLLGFALFRRARQRRLCVSVALGPNKIHP